MVYGARNFMNRIIQFRVRCVDSTNQLVRFARMKRSLGAIRALSATAPRVEATKVSTDGSFNSEWENALPFESIPGPKPAPIVGNIWRFLPRIGTFDGMDQITQNRYFNDTYGDIVRLSGLIMRKDLVFLFNPKDIETLFRNEGPWPRRDSLFSYIHYKEHVRKDVFEGEFGVLVGQGERWHKARTIVNPPMMQPRSARSYLPSMNLVADDMISKMKILYECNPEHIMPRDFLNELNKWALESICVVALNKRLGLLDPKTKNVEAEQFIKDVLRMFELFENLEVKLSLWRWLPTKTWKEFVQVMDRITEFEQKHINDTIKKLEHQTEEERAEKPGVLERLLQKDKKVAFNMSYDMLVAGIDTTSRIVSATLYYLSTNLDVQKKLHEESKRLLIKPDSPLTAEIVDQMPYLKAVIKETTRLAPIAIGNFRQSAKDMVLSGYRIPEGSDVLACNMLLCRKNEYFSNADEFIPERWLRGDNNEYVNQNLNPWVYMPFGFGPRSCIGKRLANLEIECLVTKVIRNFKIEWPHPEMKWEMSLLYGVGSPLQFKVTPFTS